MYDPVELELAAADVDVDVEDGGGGDAVVDDVIEGTVPKGSLLMSFGELVVGKGSALVPDDPEPLLVEEAFLLTINK